MSAKILAFAGSSRSGSLSQKILGLAVGAARARGAEVTLIDLRAFDLPIYDGDLEQREGLPPGAARLHGIFKAYAALLIGVTEYNGGVTPLLKNAIDWASRPHAGDPNLAAIRGKIVAMVSCSAGPMGGSRAQAHLRQSFQVMGGILVPETVTLPYAETAFDGDAPKDPAVLAFTDIVAARLVALTEKLS
ncbi:MAG TPA: NAD(P)H-dependent oxidoreductase [Stellaceae bacterium]